MRLALGEPLPPSVPSAIFEQQAPAVVSFDAYVVCLCHRRPHMKRRFFTVLLATTALVMAWLTTTTFVTAPSAWAGQVPGAASAPDISVSHHDRVYTADQWSNTVTVTDPVDNKLLGVIRLGDPIPGNMSVLYHGQVLVHGMVLSYFSVLLLLRAQHHFSTNATSLQNAASPMLNFQGKQPIHRRMSSTSSIIPPAFSTWKTP